MTTRERRVRVADVFVAILFVLGALYWLVDSSVFIRPQAVSYDGLRFTLIRQTPLGTVDAIWSQEMRVAGLVDGQVRECAAPDHIERVQRIEGALDPETGRRVGENTVHHVAGSWAIDCLAADPPIFVYHTWRVLLGPIRLRPVTLTATIDTRLEVSNCRAIKATPSGIYHDENSPWYPQVLHTEACFDDAEQAQAAGYRPPHEPPPGVFN